MKNTLSNPQPHKRNQNQIYPKWDLICLGHTDYDKIKKHSCKLTKNRNDLNLELNSQQVLHPYPPPVFLGLGKNNQQL